jgi:hypothetical protein
MTLNFSHECKYTNIHGNPPDKYAAISGNGSKTAPSTSHSSRRSRSRTQNSIHSALLSERSADTKSSAIHPDGINLQTYSPTSLAVTVRRSARANVHRSTSNLVTGPGIDDTSPATGSLRDLRRNIAASMRASNSRIKRALRARFPHSLDKIIGEYVLVWTRVITSPMVGPVNARPRDICPFCAWPCLYARKRR